MRTAKKTDVHEWLDAVGDTHSSMRDASRLRAIGTALTELELAQAKVDRAVQEAKDAGESWAAIGVVMGTSRQAAHKRYRTSAINGV